MTGLSDLDRRVLEALPGVDEAGRWPRADELAEQLGLEPKAATKALERLRGAGTVEDDGSRPRRWARGPWAEVERGGTPRAGEGYTRRAVETVVEAAREQSDFGGWLGEVLVQAADRLGGERPLTAGRPGGWEAELVQQLVSGTPSVPLRDERLPGVELDDGMGLGL